MKSTSMKLKQGLYVVALASLPAMAFAQNSENLIDNGGFESTTGKIKKLGQIDLATGWVSPTGARADVFLADSKLPEIGAPNNIYGRESAKEGENYAGIVTYSFGDKVPRSYLMAKLKTPLKKDMRYCVQFHISLAEMSKYAANQVGVNISKKAFGTDQKTAIIDQTQILHPTNKIFNAMYGWEKVCGTFTAEGGEKFITIGNFTSNEDTKNERNKKPDDIKAGTQVIGSYYYIDDVSVYLLGENEVCDCGADEDPNAVSSMIYQRTIVIDPKMSPKQKVEAQGIYFAFGKETLTPQVTAALDQIAAEMMANPAMNITLTGHSDPSEEELAVKKPYYAEMDRKRVEAVKAYLTKQNVGSGRIKTVTRGSTQANSEITPEDNDELKMAKNRRVTVTVD